MRDKKATVLINLNKSEEEIFNNFSKDLRWGIRRAQKEELKFVEKDSDEDWETFKDMFKRMWWSVTPYLNEYVTLWKHDKSRRLFFAVKSFSTGQDLIVGFAVVKVLPDRLNMEYIAPGHKDYVKWRINDFLYWNCILQAKKEGLPFFDLGGYQIGALGKTDKVNKYKEQFNGELVITEVHGNFFYILARKIVRRFPWITRMKKRLQGYTFNE
jgi:lipid II:glycine glycyltransferase (peptidoglycan interpeptide bridge formation enzyme)